MNQSQILKFLRFAVFPSLRDDKLILVGAIALMLLTSVLGIIAIEASRLAFQVLQVSFGSAPMTGVLSWLYDLGFEDLFIQFTILSGIAIAISLVTYLCLYYQYFIFEKIAVLVGERIRNMMFHKMLHLPFLAYHKKNAAHYVKRITEDTRQVRELVLEAGLMRVADIAYIVGLSAYIIYLNWQLAFVTFCMLTIYLVGAWFSASLSKGRLRIADKAFEAMVDGVEQGFSHYNDTSANQREAFEKTKFEVKTSSYSTKMIGAIRFLLVDRSLTGFLASIGPIVVLFFGGRMIIAGDMSFETLLAFTAATSVLYTPVNNISAIPMMLARSGIAASNILEIVEDPEVLLLPQPTVLGDKEKISTDEPVVSVTNVKFSYPESENQLILDKLQISPGEKIALIGPSGCGKSTLFRILFGYLDNYEGNISFLNRNLSDIGLLERRTQISYMPQDATLIRGTVRENILYGLGDHSEVEENRDITHAIETAGLEDDLDGMPEGADTLIGQGGISVSGGQVKRITLARALMKEPKLLLLDEPLTGVGANERDTIIRAIQMASQEAAILMTTHQEDLLQKMDKIIRLALHDDEDGKGQVATIDFIGTFDELQAK